MASNVDVETTNNENPASADVQNIQLNFDAIQRNFEAIQTAFNQLNEEVGSGTTPNLGLVTVNGSSFDGFMENAGTSLTLQQFADAVDARTGSNLALNTANLMNSLDGFRTQGGAKTVQTFMEFCDGALQPLIQQQPSIQAFRPNWGQVQPTGWNPFDGTDLEDAMRSFNADITRPGDFTRFELKASGNLLLATINTLPVSARNVLIPDTGEANWTDSVANHSGTDGQGRTTILLTLEGVLSNMNVITSNTFTQVFGAVAQPERFYHALTTEADGVAEEIEDYTEVTSTANPATIRFTENAIPGNTEPLYFHIMIPASFDIVNFTQISPFGNLPANSYFAAPQSRTLFTEPYNVYTFGPVIPESNATFEFVAQDTT